LSIRRGSDFWSRVIGCAYTPSHIVRLIAVNRSSIHRKLATCCQAKITNLDIVNAIRTARNKDVLRLEVTMNNAQRMNVRHPFENLPK
jgi:hypothetical protein